MAKSQIANAVDQTMFRTARSMSRWMIFNVLESGRISAKWCYGEREEYLRTLVCSLCRCSN